MRSDVTSGGSDLTLVVSWLGHHPYHLTAPSNPWPTWTRVIPYFACILFSAVLEFLLFFTLAIVGGVGLYQRVYLFYNQGTCHAYSAFSAAVGARVCFAYNRSEKDHAARQSYSSKIGPRMSKESFFQVLALLFVATTPANAVWKHVELAHSDSSDLSARPSYSATFEDIHYSSFWSLPDVMHFQANTIPPTRWHMNLGDTMTFISGSQQWRFMKTITDGWSIMKDTGAHIWKIKFNINGDMVIYNSAAKKFYPYLLVRPNQRTCDGRNVAQHPASYDVRFEDTRVSAEFGIIIGFLTSSGVFSDHVSRRGSMSGRPSVDGVRRISSGRYASDNSLRHSSGKSSRRSSAAGNLINGDTLESGQILANNPTPKLGGVSDRYPLSGTLMMPRVKSDNSIASRQSQTYSNNFLSSPKSEVDQRNAALPIERSGINLMYSNDIVPGDSNSQKYFENLAKQTNPFISTKVAAMLGARASRDGTASSRGSSRRNSRDLDCLINSMNSGTTFYTQLPVVEVGLRMDNDGAIGSFELGSASASYSRKSMADYPRTESMTKGSRQQSFNSHNFHSASSGLSRVSITPTELQELEARFSSAPHNLRPDQLSKLSSRIESNIQLQTIRNNESIRDGVSESNIHASGAPQSRQSPNRDPIDHPFNPGFFLGSSITGGPLETVDEKTGSNGPSGRASEGSSARGTTSRRVSRDRQVSSAPISVTTSKVPISWIPWFGSSRISGSVEMTSFDRSGRHPSSSLIQRQSVDPHPNSSPEASNPSRGSLWTCLFRGKSCFGIPSEVDASSAK